MFRRPTVQTLDLPDAPTRQAFGRLTLSTVPRSMTEITDAVAGWLAGTGIRAGLLTLFLRHTSASLVIQENADPDVQADLLDAFDRLAPANAGYRHGIEGADDMPAHVKTALTGVSLGIPVTGGRMDLGTWQGIYLFEHRARPHERSVTLHLLGA